MLENVFEPMIAKLAPLAEVHVMLPAPWREKYRAVASAQATSWCHEVTWHPLDAVDGDLAALDLNGPTPEILEAADAIAPDHCLCRSANSSLPERLPGRVRYVMEAGAPPFRLPSHWVSLQPQIFDHGLMPDLPPEQRAALIALIAHAWEEIERARRRDPTWRSRHGLPDRRTIIALPLDYEHADNLFGIHRSIRPNAALAAHLADRMRAPLFLAVTDHPLNVRFVDQRNLIETIDARSGVAQLLHRNPTAGDITSALTQHADGMIVGDSKSFSAAAFYGTPLLRMSRFASAPWLCAYEDPDSFVADLAAENAVAARREDAMLWFAHYLAAQAFAPRDADVTGAEILGRIAGDVGPKRWPDWFARVTQLQHGADEQVTAKEAGK